MAEWKLEGPLSEQVASLERALATAKAAVQDWKHRAEVQQGAIDSLTHQLHEAMVRMVNPPMIVRPPEGTAIYRETSGVIHTEVISWAHAFNMLNPEPAQHVELFGQRWRRLMWKKDIAHLNYVLALYVPEPR